MGWMIMLLAVLLIAWFVMRGQMWKTLLVGSGDNAEDIEAKYAYLKTNDVRCQLRSEAAAGMGIADPSVRGRSTVKLNVHKNDLERAGRLLDEYGKVPLSL